MESRNPVEEALKNIICRAIVANMYISVPALFLYIHIVNKDGDEFDLICESGWRFVDICKQKVVIGEYDCLDIKIDDVNKMLHLWCEEKDKIKIDTLTINRMGDLSIGFSNNLELNLFVSGCGDIINWKLDKSALSESICMMSSKKIYYNDQHFLLQE